MPHPSLPSRPSHGGSWRALIVALLGSSLASGLGVGLMACSPDKDPNSSTGAQVDSGTDDPGDTSSDSGDGDTATPCEAGSYDAGEAGCLPCADGTVSDAGATTCSPCPADTHEVENDCLDCPADTTSPAGATACAVAAIDGTHDPRDYGYLFWPGNHWTTWGTFHNIQHVQTGFYGLALDVSRGNLDHMGSLRDGPNRKQARHSDNDTITDLPSTDLRYTVVLDGAEHAATGFLDIDGAATNPSRIIDMGRFMQRVEIPQVTYAGGAPVSGSIQLAAMPRHFVLTHRATPASNADDLTLRIELAGELTAGFSAVEWLDGTRAVSLRDGAGRGWSFILPETQTGSTRAEIIRDEGGEITFEAHFEGVTAGEELALSVVAIPSNAGTEAQHSVWLHPAETVRVRYAQKYRDGSDAEALVDARWDPERGLFVVDLRDLSAVGGGGRDWANLDTHNWYNRHKVVVENNSAVPLSVPIAFEGGNNAAYYIVGGSPMLRDENGEPTGAAMQISKNWHESPFWYHLYSTLELPPGEHTFEHTFAHAKWGETYAAAHAQLSLIGWGKNQQWDESSLGAFGESITYDPDFTLGRAMVDDVRPAFVDAAGEWSWTGNVGGANFLVYATEDTDSRPDHQLGRLRTDYAATGPNLTDVTYAGVTRDGRIEATVTTQLTRTDDLIRAYYHLRYEFLEDVSYDRLALFQVAADRYGDNGFSRYAYGDATEVLFDEAVPDHNTTGYASESDRGIALTGPAPWVMLYASEHDEGSLPEDLANVGFVIREYLADLGGESVTTPHINIMRTTNHGWSQMSFELGVPVGADGLTIPAGSVVTATVEYLVPPADKTTWYGDSDYLCDLAPEKFQSTEMMRTLAAGNHLAVETTVGSVLRTHPVSLLADPGVTAVDFHLSGGLGYVPVTISGLARPDGWHLEQQVEDAWVPVDQSVEGNDYWQARYVGDQDHYELVFNLPNRDTQRYRLAR